MIRQYDCTPLDLKFGPLKHRRRSWKWKSLFRNSFGCRPSGGEGFCYAVCGGFAKKSSGALEEGRSLLLVSISSHSHRGIRRVKMTHSIVFFASSLQRYIADLFPKIGSHRNGIDGSVFEIACYNFVLSLTQVR